LVDDAIMIGFMMMMMMVVVVNPWWLGRVLVVEHMKGEGSSSSGPLSDRMAQLIKACLSVVIASGNVVMTRVLLEVGGGKRLGKEVKEGLLVEARSRKNYDITTLLATAWQEDSQRQQSPTTTTTTAMKNEL